MATKTIDRVQDEDVSGKIDQVADLVRQGLRKDAKAGKVDALMLQCVIEHGGLFQEALLPVAIKIGSISRLIDSALLEPIGVVPAGAVETFSAADKFRKGETDDVVIGWIGDNFQNHFGAKIESGVLAQNLRIHRLRKGSVDRPIIDELGGETVVETNLVTMWEMMKKQGHGQQGDLLTNGYANIFYIKDAKGVLWAVYCFWDSDYGYWYVCASPITHLCEWFAGSQAGSQVFSCDSGS